MRLRSLALIGLVGFALLTAYSSPAEAAQRARQRDPGAAAVRPAPPPSAPAPAQRAEPRRAPEARPARPEPSGSSQRAAPRRAPEARPSEPASPPPSAQRAVPRRAPEARPAQPGQPPPPSRARPATPRRAPGGEQPAETPDNTRRAVRRPPSPPEETTRTPEAEQPSQLSTDSTRRAVRRPPAPTGGSIADSSGVAGPDGRFRRGGAYRAEVDRRPPYDRVGTAMPRPAIIGRPVIDYGRHVAVHPNVIRIYHQHVYLPAYTYPRIYGSFFYFPGFATLSFGLGHRHGYGYYDPYWYDPYYSGYPYAYGYRDYGPPGYYMGALRLKVRPRHAEVYVDGYYVGRVDDFDGVFQRLRLEEGPHKIEIRTPGYEPIWFEVLIVPGETITYEADLRRFP